MRFIQGAAGREGVLTEGATWEVLWVCMSLGFQVILESNWFGKKTTVDQVLSGSVSSLMKADGSSVFSGGPASLSFAKEPTD